VCVRLVAVLRSSIIVYVCGYKRKESEIWEGREVTYEPVEFHLHGNTRHGDGFRVGVVALAFCLDGGEHHESSVASENISDEAVMRVCL
jgi:hypothetical protein